MMTNNRHPSSIGSILLIFLHFQSGCHKGSHLQHTWNECKNRQSQDPIDSLDPYEYGHLISHQLGPYCSFSTHPRWLPQGLPPQTHLKLLPKQSELSPNRQFGSIMLFNNSTVLNWVHTGHFLHIQSGCQKGCHHHHT